MSEDLKKGEWNKNDMCSKMIKENGEVIVKLSEKIEKEVLDMFLNSEEVNLFLEETDKKKITESVTASVDKMLVEDRVYTHPLFAYDSRFPGGVDEKDLYEKEERKAVDQQSSSQFWKTFKNNLKDTSLQFLKYGPGKTNFNIFRNTLDSILNGVISDKFVEKFGRIYNADNKLRIVFNAIMDGLTNRQDAKTISSEILLIAKSITAKSTENKEEKRNIDNSDVDNYHELVKDYNKKVDSKNEFKGINTSSKKLTTSKSSLIAASLDNINMFATIANFIAIIMKYYQELILNELDNKSIEIFKEAKLSSGIRQLYSNILTCAQAYDLNNDKVKCFANEYVNYVENKPDPIGPLLVLIYTAITVYNMSKNVGSSLKDQQINQLNPININQILSNKKTGMEIESINGTLLTIKKDNKDRFKIDLRYQSDRDYAEVNLNNEDLNKLINIIGEMKTDPYGNPNEFIAEFIEKIINNPVNKVISRL